MELTDFRPRKRHSNHNKGNAKAVFETTHHKDFKVVKLNGTDQYGNSWIRCEGFGWTRSSRLKRLLTTLLTIRNINNWLPCAGANTALSSPQLAPSLVAGVFFFARMPVNSLSGCNWRDKLAGLVFGYCCAFWSPCILYVLST